MPVAAQSQGTTDTTVSVVQIFDYFATHTDAKLHFRDHGMILHIHSDPYYLSEVTARSHEGGEFS